MQNIIGVYSYRRIHPETFFWQIVFEWEDIFAKEDIQLVDRPQFIKNYKYLFVNKTNKLLCYIYALFFRQYYFYFAMESYNYSDKLNNKIVIQNIIDFYLNKKELPDFYREHRNNPFLLIASKEVLEFLYLNICPIKCYHFPLSISDKYRINENSFFEKEYDLVMVGRQNHVLNAYYEKYANTHPEFSYVYGVRNSEEEDSIYYTSTGVCLGNLDRNEYIELLKKSKVGLYSTPGIDNSRLGANGYNQVTPRFLELIACGCHIIARYPENPDTVYYQMSDICPHTETFEEFEKQMDYALNYTVDMKKYADYLENHYTSMRVNLLKEILSGTKTKIK